MLGRFESSLFPQFADAHVCMYLSRQWGVEWRDERRVLIKTFHYKENVCAVRFVDGRVSSCSCFTCVRSAKPLERLKPSVAFATCPSLGHHFPEQGPTSKAHCYLARIMNALQSLHNSPVRLIRHDFRDSIDSRQNASRLSSYEANDFLSIWYDVFAFQFMLARILR